MNTLLRWSIKLTVRTKLGSRRSTSVGHLLIPLKIIFKKSIKNTDVCIEDVNRAEFIYGPAVPLLQGKMTRPTALPRVMGKHLVALPAPIEDFHRDVVLCIDFFFCKWVTFFSHHFSKHTFPNCGACSFPICQGTCTCTV